MKNLLLALFVVTAFAACKSNSDQPDQTRNIQLLSDSTAYNNNVFSDTNKVVKAEPVPEKISEKPRTIVIVKTVEKSPANPVKIATASPVPDQVTNVPTVATPPVVTTPAPEKTTVDNPTAGTNSSETASSGSETKVQKKKGLNKASQGAIIGGVGGAVVSKKKGLGAVVGAVVGAAGGYIIGKKMDKKDNQFELE